MENLMLGLSQFGPSVGALAVWAGLALLLALLAKAFPLWVAGLLILVSAAYPIYRYDQATTAIQQDQWVPVIAVVVGIGLVVLIVGVIVQRRRHT